MIQKVIQKKNTGCKKKVRNLFKRCILLDNFLQIKFGILTAYLESSQQFVHISIQKVILFFVLFLNIELS